MRTSTEQAFVPGRLCYSRMTIVIPEWRQPRAFPSWTGHRRLNPIFLPDGSNSFPDGVAEVLADRMKNKKGAADVTQERGSRPPSYWRRELTGRDCVSPRFARFGKCHRDLRSTRVAELAERPWERREIRRNAWRCTRGRGEGTNDSRVLRDHRSGTAASGGRTVAGGWSEHRRPSRSDGLAFPDRRARRRRR